MDMTIKTCLSPRKQKKMNNTMRLLSKVGNVENKNVMDHPMFCPVFMHGESGNSGDGCSYIG